MLFVMAQRSQDSFWRHGQIPKADSDGIVNRIADCRGDGGQSHFPDAMEIGAFTFQGDTVEYLRDIQE
jgi:hypothetical protein